MTAGTLRAVRYAAVAAAPVITGRVAARQSFRRLWVAHTSSHSHLALTRPRRDIWRKPRQARICPKTGSTVAFRRAYAARPAGLTSRALMAARASEHRFASTGVVSSGSPFRWWPPTEIKGSVHICSAARTFSTEKYPASPVVTAGTASQLSTTRRSIGSKCWTSGAWLLRAAATMIW